MEALAGARPGARAWILDTFGLLGSGKTKFLERLRAELPARRPTATFEIALSQADQLRGSEGRDLTRAAERFCDVVGRLVDDFVAQEPERSEKEARRAMEPVTLALTDARKPVAPIQSHARVLSIFSRFEQPSIGAVRAILSDTFVAQDIEKKQTALAEKLAETLPSALHGRSALVTIDGFEWVAGGPLGDWLLHLVNRLSDTVAVLARTPGGAAPVMTDADVVTKALPPLTSEEIATLLGSCLQTTHGRRPPGRSRDGVQQGPCPDGRPRRSSPGAARAGRARRGRGEAAAAGTPRGPGEGARRSRRRDPRARRSRGRGARALQLDRPTLRRAAAGGGRRARGRRRRGRGRRAPALLLRRSRAGPARRLLRRPRLHPRRARAAADDDDPERARKRHAVAAEHIARWLAEYEEGEFPDGRKAYGAWYRYERAEWRAAVQEWLYHEARGAGGPGAKRMREQARLRFARLFFDAFWWWGCYSDFPAIRTLLADWRATQADVAWTTQLVSFLEAYPTGWDKDDDPERWAQVERSLRLVRAACGLAGDPARDDEEQRHVRGLMENFSAHAERYARADDHDAERRAYEKALEHYDQAARIFTADDDEWDLAWTVFERAELHLEHGGAEAHEDWLAAVDLLPELGDDELTANVYRLAADARWPESPQHAFALHGRAILHAYLFQGRYQGMRYRPDAYTLEFYAEQVERALDRLVGARAGRRRRRGGRGSADPPARRRRARCRDGHSRLRRRRPRPTGAALSGATRRGRPRTRRVRLPRGLGGERRRNGRATRDGPAGRLVSAEIRPMRVEDLPAVYNLGLRCYHVLDKPYNYWSVREVADHFEGQPGLCFVAAEGDDVVGFVLGAESYEILEDTGHLEWVAVAPEHRRDGLGDTPDRRLRRGAARPQPQARRRGRLERERVVARALPARGLGRGHLGHVLHSPARLRPRRAASQRACSARSAANGSLPTPLLRAAAAWAAT